MSYDKTLEAMKRELGDFDSSKSGDGSRIVDGLVKRIIPNSDGTENIMIGGWSKPFALPRGTQIEEGNEVRMKYLNGPRDPYLVLNVDVYGDNGKFRRYMNLSPPVLRDSEVKTGEYTGKAA